MKLKYIILTIGLIVLAHLIILFVCLLIFSLMQQVASFVVSVFQEIVFRL